METTTIFNLIVWGVIFAIIVYKFVRSIRIVPNRYAYIVERLGKYHRTLDPGFHALIPFFDRIAYIQDLKEESMDVPPQECFTKDNVQVIVDGVLYISIKNAQSASYGVTDYKYAATQLAQTTTRSVIGTLDLDQTFEERDVINSRVVNVLSEAGELWGITVHRFEIKNITPPKTVQDAMEKQMGAEREKRAKIAISEGEKQSRINRSEGLKSEMINRSEGEKQRQINEAEGKASEIRAIAIATGASIIKIGEAVSTSRGEEAVRLRLTQEYLKKYGTLGKSGNNVIIPKDISNIRDVLASIGLPLNTTKSK